ncbi:hypothetical protein B0H14DRAFT_3498257 [Mycena olivaceomarginata]|nr:hypothetical protein B0H14DRAFT_3498257 [Mycena olivaceomarginata]
MTASLLPPTQSRFTPVAAQLPHAADALFKCMQPRSLEPAPTSQSIASRRSSAARYPAVLGQRCTHPALRLGDVHARRLGSSRQCTDGWCVARADTTYPSIYPSGPESRVPSRRAIFVLFEKGTPRALAERLPIPLPRRSRVFLDSRRSER